MSGHIPVLLKETLGYLDPKSAGRYLDGTFGGGGHTRTILSAAEGVHVVGLDRDPEALIRASDLLENYPEHFSFYSMNFGDVADLDEKGFDGVLLDVGVSSFQLDDGERGFSFREDAPLDMRMDPDTGMPAAEFLETAEERDLVRAIRDYGQERHWKRLVRAIVQVRGTGVLLRTKSFAEFVKKTLGWRGNMRSIHPATQVFQGIRIAINGELDALAKALPAVFDKLNEGGVMVVISFHSLEDKIVKQFFREMGGMPVSKSDSRSVQDRVKYGEILTRKPVQPGEVELEQNPRSRSARLRAFRKELPR